MSLLLNSLKRPWEAARSAEAALTLPRENRAAGGVRRGGGPNSPNRDREDLAVCAEFRRWDTRLRPLGEYAKGSLQAVAMSSP